MLESKIMSLQNLLIRIWEEICPDRGNERRVWPEKVSLNFVIYISCHRFNFEQFLFLDYQLLASKGTTISRERESRSADGHRAALQNACQRRVECQSGKQLHFTLVSPTGTTIISQPQSVLITSISSLFGFTHNYFYIF